METDQKSSDDKVSGFMILSKNGVFCEKCLNIPYLLIDECLYSICETVICLITVPIVEEFGGFGGNFHNRHGIYLIWTCVP